MRGLPVSSKHWTCISGATSQNQSFSSYELSNLSLFSLGVHWESAGQRLARKILASQALAWGCPVNPGSSKVTSYIRNTSPFYCLGQCFVRSHKKGIYDLILIFAKKYDLVQSASSSPVSDEMVHVEINVILTIRQNVNDDS